MNQDFATPADVRARNLSLTLNIIRESGSLTRASLIETTHLSATTISSLVNVLIASDFVHEAGTGLSSGGRRPVVLEFNYDARSILGVDMGASHITSVLMNLSGKIRARLTRSVDVVNKPEDALNVLRSMIFQIMSQSGDHTEDLLGVGYTIPAPLTNPETGEFLTYYMPAWRGIRPVDEMHKIIDAPVYMENDANAAAMAENWWGSGRGFNNMIYIKIGTGVGSGLILDHTIYRGYSGNAGEIGHTTIESDGRLCRCGNKGCMEAYVGLPGFLKDARRALADDPVWKLKLDQLKMIDVIEEARRGNLACKEVISNAGKYLGIGIANLINLFNPAIVILGGDLTAAGPILMDSVHLSLRERSMPFESHKDRLILGELGGDAVAIGAATFVLQNAFNETNLYQTLRRNSN